MSRCQFLVVEVGSLDSAHHVFFSGQVHGDERVGPASVIESLKLLCDGSLDVSLGDRLVVALPMANPLGYFAFMREEGSIDPNRDFPYDPSDSNCLQSLTARVIHRIFHHYRFIKTGITFHAGEESITHPWGSFLHMGQEAPDTKFLKALATNLQLIAGSETYTVGSMNNVVYPVHGGLEDWAYVLGVQTEDACVADSQTVNTSSLSSASIFLVETTTDKSPAVDELGNTNELWITDPSVYISPVPRCVRMIIQMIGLVKPRATLVPIQLEDTSVPLILRGCITANVNLDITCPSIEASAVTMDALSCSKLIAFMKVPAFAATDCRIHASFVFDEDLASEGGFLDYSRNRTGEEPASDLQIGACAEIDQGLFVCVSSSTVMIHPYLIRHRGSVTLFDKGLIVGAQSSITSAVSSWIVDIEDVSDLTLQFTSATDPTYTRSAQLSTSTDSKEPNSKLLYLLLLLLAVPLAFLLMRSIRMRRVSYLAISTASPKSVNSA